MQLHTVDKSCSAARCADVTNGNFCKLLAAPDMACDGM